MFGIYANRNVVHYTSINYSVNNNNNCTKQRFWSCWPAYCFTPAGLAD